MRTHLALACSTAGLAALAGAQTTVRVSVASTGAEADESSDTPSIDGSGRFVVFASEARNLVPGDTNGRTDVFVHDRITGATERASVDSSGGQANGDSLVPRVSHGGRFVVFASYASNLVPGDTNGKCDVFVRDLALGTTARASVGAGGVQATGDSYYCAISADGRYVAFESAAANLVAGDTNNKVDLFVIDRQSGAVTRESVATTGEQGNGNCDAFDMTADARFVAFTSGASNFVPGDDNVEADVYLRDRAAGTTVRISVDSSDVGGNSYSGMPSISADGSVVAFYSIASNLVVDDLNGLGDVFVRHVVAGATSRASVSSAGVEGSERSHQPALSGDGRVVAFRSVAANLVAGDTNGVPDVYVRDLQAQVTVRASVGADGQEASAESASPALSGDGSAIVFASAAPNLVAGDSNGAWDVFVRTEPAACSATAYCTAGTSAAGCVPRLAAVGCPSAAASSGFVLRVSGADGERTGSFVYGVDGEAAIPWGSSWMCVARPRRFVGPLPTGGTAGECDGSFETDWSAFVAQNPTTLGAPFLQGDTVWTQAWCRDPSSARGTVLSGALRFVLLP